MTSGIGGGTKKFYYDTVNSKTMKSAEEVTQGYTTPESTEWTPKSVIGFKS